MIIGEALVCYGITLEMLLGPLLIKQMRLDQRFTSFCKSLI